MVLPSGTVFVHLLHDIHQNWPMTLFGGFIHRVPLIALPGFWLLCLLFDYCMFDLSVYYMYLQYFDTVGWVF